MPNWEHRRYLGDGVYVASDGWQIRLTTETGMGVPTNTIYLEKTVLEALREYAIKFGLAAPDHGPEEEE